MKTHSVMSLCVFCLCTEKLLWASKISHSSKYIENVKCKEITFIKKAEIFILFLFSPEEATGFTGMLPLNIFSVWMVLWNECFWLLLWLLVYICITNFFAYIRICLTVSSNKWSLFVLCIIYLIFNIYHKFAYFRGFSCQIFNNKLGVVVVCGIILIHENQDHKVETTLLPHFHQNNSFLRCK